MKKIILYSILSFVFIPCFALPARQGIIQALQPDGTTISIRMEGDSEHKRLFSEEGFLLTTDSLGYYVYAESNSLGEVVPSSMRVSDVGNSNPEILEKISKLNQAGLTESYPVKEREEVLSLSSRGPGLGLSKFPSYGEQRSVVILVEFENKGFTIEDPKDFYSRMMNEPGFCDSGATGSVRDYFISNSNGQFIPQFDVYGPVVLDNPYSYYGKNNQWGDDSRPWDMVIEACELLDDEIDFSLYDRNGDGVIDNVYVFYAGYGEADGGGASTIWPHSYDITSVTRKPYMFDEVRLDHYACSNELQKMNEDIPDGIGTFCHEFSHVLGLPDLYSTVFNNAFTPLTWSILDHGSYNNYSRTPPNYSAYERFALDWVTPEILQEGEIVLNPLDESNEVFLVLTDDSDEYFLLENRQQNGFDEFLPGHGMLIWHIDFDYRKWLNNTVNNSVNHQNVDLIEADNKKSQVTLDGDPFPGKANVTEFSCETLPAFVTWKNVNMPLRLFNIEETEDGVITFSVEECPNADVKLLSMDSDLFSINGNIIKAGNDPIDIYKLNGTKVTTLKNTSEELKSGIYIAFSKDRAVKFLIP